MNLALYRSRVRSNEVLGGNRHIVLVSLVVLGLHSSAYPVSCAANHERRLNHRSWNNFVAGQVSPEAGRVVCHRSEQNRWVLPSRQKGSLRERDAQFILWQLMQEVCNYINYVGALEIVH